MGWKEILGKREAPDLEPMLVDRQQILAYLEELSRLRTSCQLKFRKEDFSPAVVKVESVSEEAQTFTVSLSRALPAKVEEHPSMEFTFPMERGRFLCSVFFHQRGGYLQAVLGLPLRIKLAERRIAPRARFGPRERASVTLIESLGSGIGATGKLKNMSKGGLALRIERMISIADDHRQNPTASAFSVGQRFLLMRISDLPHAPMLECGASIAYAIASPEGTFVGVQFEGLGSLEARTIEQVLQRRLPKSGMLFPVKVRRSLLSIETGGPEGAPTEEEWDADESVDPENVMPPPTEAALQDDEDDSWLDRSDPKERVRRLRRAGRNILLVIPEDMDRAILAGTLIVDGFRRVREARNFIAAVESVRAVPPEVVVLDQRIGSHDAQQFLDRIRQNGLGEDVPVILLADKADVRTTLMAKAARISHVQTKPVDYDGSLRGVLERLLRV